MRPAQQRLRGEEGWGGHPQLGLQLYTLGSLLATQLAEEQAQAVEQGSDGEQEQRQEKRRTEARKCLEEAVGILHLSHGGNNRLVTGVEELLKGMR